MRRCSAFVLSYLISLLCLLVPERGVAQTRSVELRAGAFVPFMVHPGASVGVAVESPWPRQHQAPRPVHALHLLPQLHYFHHPTVSNNLLLDPTLEYRLRPRGGLFYLSASLSTGYLLSLQKQSGRLDLGTGELDYETKAQSFFLPQLALGVGLTTRKRLGFYLTGSGGRQFGESSATFVSLAGGLSFDFARGEAAR